MLVDKSQLFLGKLVRNYVLRPKMERESMKAQFPEEVMKQVESVVMQLFKPK